MCIAQWYLNRDMNNLIAVGCCFFLFCCFFSARRVFCRRERGGNYAAAKVPAFSAIASVSTADGRLAGTGS